MKATTTGIDTYSLELVPAVTLTPDPQQVMVPAERALQPVTLLARVRYHGTKPAKVSVGLDGPKAGKFRPIAAARFSPAPRRPIDPLQRRPPANIAPGAYRCIPMRSWTAKFSAPRSNRSPRFRRAIGASLPTHRSRHESRRPRASARRLYRREKRSDSRHAAPDRHSDGSARRSCARLRRSQPLRRDRRRHPRLRFAPRSAALQRRLLDYVQRGGSLVVQYQRDSPGFPRCPIPRKCRDDFARHRRELSRVPRT